MNFVKEGLVSGSAIVDGFKTDGRFIPSAAIPSYLCWEFVGSDDFFPSGFKFDSPQFDIELVSIVSARSSGDTTLPASRIDSLICDSGKIVGGQGDLIPVFNIKELTLPISFTPGLIVPANSRLSISLNDTTKFLRVVAKAVSCEIISGLTVLV